MRGACADGGGERRGPVKASKAPFATAVDTLDGASYPYQVAESHIGVPRVTSQDNKSTPADLEAVQSRIRLARELLAPLRTTETRQLREQGNALFWLIEQKLTAREEDLNRKEARYAEVYDNLWSSFAERLRIARHDDSALIDQGTVPGLGDGLAPERAFYNLAGAAIQLAKTHHQLASRAAA